MRMMRSHASATSGLCVTSTNVVPVSVLMRRRVADDLLGRRGVQVAGRLVAEDDRRVVDERPRDRDALLLSAGQLARGMAHPVAQADEVEQPPRLLDGASARHARVLRRERDVLQRR